MLRMRKATTLLETLVAVAILTMVFVSSTRLFGAGTAYWKIADARAELQEKLNRSLEKVSLELMESGFNSAGVIQASVLDNTGTDGTDILRFAVPLCLCGTSPINDDGDVNNWGAPTVWGQSGCETAWTIEGDGTVTICHLPSSSSQTLSVNQNAVNAHLAHGDWIGSCGSCSLTYTNKTVQYSRDSSKRLVRSVLDSSNTSISQAYMADELQAFQVTLDTVNGKATLNMTFSRTLAGGRQINATGSLEVVLRNRG